MITVKDLPRPCFLRTQENPDTYATVLVFCEECNTLTAVNIFHHDPFNSSDLFKDTPAAFHEHGVQWSPDGQTWNSFEP